MEFSSNKEIYIFYKRALKQDTLNQWNTRRMTGFSFDWHIENDQKEEIRIAAEKKYDGPEWTRNSNLIRWTNSPFNLIIEQDLTIEEVWQQVSQIKTSWTKQKEFYAPCKFGQADDVQMLMDKIDVERETPNKIRPAILEEAYTMYTYLSYCPEREDSRL